MRSSTMSTRLYKMPGWTSSLCLAIGLRRERLLVHTTRCIRYQERPGYHASPGMNLVKFYLELGSCIHTIVPSRRTLVEYSSPSRIYEVIDNFQSLYKFSGRSFSDWPSSTSDVPCRTGSTKPYAFTTYERGC